MATKIILIRHARTSWNSRGIYCGSTDIGLSALGKKQARLLSRRMNNGFQIEKVFCSNKRRAMETAQIVFKGKPIRKVRDLRELHFGCLEGLTHQEIMTKYPAAYSRWLNDPFSARLPRGEDSRLFRKRVLRAFKKIALANKNKTVAIVTHGGVIAVLLTRVLKKNNFWKLIPGSTSISIIEFGARMQPRARILNDTEHLNG